MKKEIKVDGFRGHILVPITFQIVDVQEDSTLVLRSEMLGDINGQIIDIRDIKDTICLDCGLKCNTNNLLNLIKKEYGASKN